MRIVARSRGPDRRPSRPPGAARHAATARRARRVTGSHDRASAARRGTSGRAYLLLTLTALCWGGNAVFGRLAVGEISPMALVSLRWLGALGLLVVFAHAQVRRDWPAMRPRLPFVAVMGAIGFTVFNAMFYVAAHWTTAVNIGIIQGSVPVFVLIGAFAAYRTPVAGLQVAGVLVTMLGVAIVAAGGDLARLASLALNFGDVLMIAACVALCRLHLGPEPPPAGLPAQPVHGHGGRRVRDLAAAGAGRGGARPVPMADRRPAG